MKSNNEKEPKKTKTYAFWISVCSAIMLVFIQILGIFGIFVEEKTIMDIISGVLGALVVAGILIGPIKTEEETPEKKTDKEDQDM